MKDDQMFSTIIIPQSMWFVKIFRGTVPSERHASFMSADEARRSALKKSTSWGPVDDVGQQEAVFEYCEDLIQRSAGDSEGTPGSESGSEQLDKHTYAFEVFCPEAITKAISRLARVGMETAAQLFLKGTICALTTTRKISATISCVCIAYTFVLMAFFWVFVLI